MFVVADWQIAFQNIKINFVRKIKIPIGDRNECVCFLFLFACKLSSLPGPDRTPTLQILGV